MGSALEEEGEGITDGDAEPPAATKPKKFASNETGAKKKAASNAREVDVDKKEVREAESEPLTQSELASIIP